MPEIPAARARPRREPGTRRHLAFLGPAFVAAIAYVDPGNFATNFTAGSAYGDRLLWVVVAANLVAMLVQSLSARLGLATGRNLCEVSRDAFPRAVVLVLWAQAEVVAAATDLAEVVGGAVALDLLFGLPLLDGGILTGAVAIGLLALHRRGHRRFELVVGGLLAVIALGLVVDLARTHVDAPAVAAGLVPSFAGPGSVLLAAGILGATVMPHVIYLHSGLTQNRVLAADATQRRRQLRYQRLDVLLAMGTAGAVNVAMLLVAAAVFAGTVTDSLDGIYAGLGATGRIGAVAFALALLVAGLASSGVGTLAGQVVLQGYLRRRVPLLLRRALTLAPALVVLGAGADPTRALVGSQVVLSFGIPFALVPLVLLTRRRDVMGELACRPVTTVVAGAAAAVIVALNAVLVVNTVLGG